METLKNVHNLIIIILKCLELNIIWKYKPPKYAVINLRHSKMKILKIINK